MTDDAGAAQTPRLPTESAATKWAQRITEQVGSGHQESLNAINAQLDATVIADIQRATVAAQMAVDAMVAQHSKRVAILDQTAAILAGTVRETTARHLQLFRLVSAACATPTSRQVFEQVAVEANFTGEGKFSATVEVVGAHPAPTPDITVRTLTRNEWIGAVCILASLNEVITRLREGDLLDAGQLALLIAGLVAIVACGSPPSEP